MSSEVQAKCTISSGRSETERANLLLEEILERFDVVIGLGLERLDAARVGHREVS